MLIVLHPLFYFLLSGIYLVAKGTRKIWAIWAIFAYFFSISKPISFLIGHLEGKYPPNTTLSDSYDTSGIVNILVLGSGKNDDPRLKYQQRLSPVALMRLIEGVRLSILLPRAKLITSGSIGHGDKSQAQLMKETAVALGIRQDRIFIQEAIYNTRSEAEAYVSSFGKETPLILCTSAIHLPRAVAWFEAKGVKQIIAAPTDYLAPKSAKWHWQGLIPSIRNMDLWKQWLKEIIGMFLVK